MISLSDIRFSDRVATKDLICVFSSYVNLDNITTYTGCKDKVILTTYLVIINYLVIKCLFEAY